MDDGTQGLAHLTTPAVLIDLAKVKRNIKRHQDYADRHGLKLRPHIKTHQLPQIATMQLRAGAIGVTCQKVSVCGRICGRRQEYPNRRTANIQKTLVGPAGLEPATRPL